MVEVVVIGGANIDIKAKMLEPNRLGTSNPGVVSTSPGGVGRNIAHNLAHLGAGVALITVVGDDAYGEAVLRDTINSGCDVSRVIRTHMTTGTYVALLDHDGELITALSDMRTADALTPDVVLHNQALIQEARLVVADCNLPLATLCALAELAGGKLVIEPVSVPKSAKLIEVLARHEIFLASPNFDQLETLTGTRDIEGAAAYLHGKGLRNIVMHAGAEGAFVSDGKEIDHVPAQPPPRIVDVTGAGDAAVAGLVFGLLRGDDMVHAAMRGQVLAGRVMASTASTLE